MTDSWGVGMQLLASMQKLGLDSGCRDSSSRLGGASNILQVHARTRLIRAYKALCRGGYGPSGVWRSGICRMLYVDFREFLYHAVG